ncbi:hypothetical protein NW762_003098 [Fusarium torreyae]|uniref:Uncharacterized protein n=1 Tax=Fusarium torreyae TaxID=1237075 RepID=A0A9W8SA35_9HYPO|nr:hypothetical protein NW762_003098 [Fusarium torreyae]
MADVENHLEPLPCCPTPRADYGNFSEFSELFSYPLSPTTDQRSISELFFCAQTPRAELDEISDLFSCASPLEDTLNNNTPLSAPPIDDCNHCGCSDVDDEAAHHCDDNEDNKDNEDHEDDVVFISSQPIQHNNPSSPIKHEDFHISTQEPSFANRKHIEDNSQSDAPSTQTSSFVQAQETLARDAESITREPIFVLGLFVGAILQKIMHSSSSENSLSRLATQCSSQNHQMIPDRTLEANKPLKVKTKASASPRKRKLKAESIQDARPRLKKTKLSSRQPEHASYKPMVVILTDKCTAKSQPEKWEYEWNIERKLWVADNAPQWMREWRGEALLSFREYLTIRVRPNSDWLPVDVQWREGGEGEEGVFEGSDNLEENDWTYQITSKAMLSMLSGGVTGMGTVTK